MECNLLHHNYGKKGPEINPWGTPVVICVISVSLSDLAIRNLFKKIMLDLLVVLIILNYVMNCKFGTH